jgi:hypothetical protein
MPIRRADLSCARREFFRARGMAHRALWRKASARKKNLHFQSNSHPFEPCPITSHATNRFSACPLSWEQQQPHSTSHHLARIRRIPYIASCPLLEPLFACTDSLSAIAIANQIMPRPILHSAHARLPIFVWYLSDACISSEKAPFRPCVDPRKTCKVLSHGRRLPATVGNRRRGLRAILEGVPSV